MAIDPSPLIETVAFDREGLVVVVVQDVDDGSVRMVGYMDRAAIAATCETGRVTFYSRSKRRLWVKGESSGHGLELVELRIDCDADALLALVRAHGPTCHTGAPSCMFRRAGTRGLEPAPHAGASWAKALARLQQTIDERAQTLDRPDLPSPPSYVHALLRAGPAALAAKLREEAAELAQALDAEPEDRVAAEAADLLFHVLVALRARGLDLAAVASVLETRRGIGGLIEKAARRPGPEAPTR